MLLASFFFALALYFLVLACYFLLVVRSSLHFARYIFARQFLLVNSCLLLFPRYSLLLTRCSRRFACFLLQLCFYVLVNLKVVLLFSVATSSKNTIMMRNYFFIYINTFHVLRKELNSKVKWRKQSPIQNPVKNLTWRILLHS